MSGAAGARRQIRLVARREVRVRMRARAIKVSTLLFVVVILAIGVISRASRDQAPSTTDVATVGAVPASFGEALAQVAVDQLEPAVGQLVGQQAACEADLGIEVEQGAALGVGVDAGVVLVRHQVAGPHADVLDDAIAHLRGRHYPSPGGFGCRAAPIRSSSREWASRCFLRSSRRGKRSNTRS